MDSLNRTRRALLRGGVLAAVAMCFACADGSTNPSDGPEIVTAGVNIATTFVGHTFPELTLMVAGSGQSSRGNTVAVVSMSVDGNGIQSSVRTVEGAHDVCVTVANSSGVQSSACQTFNLQWPRIEGRAAMFGTNGGAAPAGLTIRIDNDSARSIDSQDGTFSIPTLKAQADGARLRFESAEGVLPAQLTHRVGKNVKLVMIPSPLTIPACSHYAGRSEPIDLVAGYAPASEGQTSYFDRTNRLSAEGAVVVASWKLESIPVALADTGGSRKTFSIADSNAVATALSMLTDYVCQDFHFVPMAEALAQGVVIYKNPDITARGAHSMALPESRGDYGRATITLRGVSSDVPAVQDTLQRTMMHEFFHVFGFGHTCSWPTVMTTGTECASTRYSLVPTTQDVAHFFAMRFARSGERSLETLDSFWPAWAFVLQAQGQGTSLLRPYFSLP